MVTAKAKSKPTSLAEEREAREQEKKRPTKPISSHNFLRWQHAHEIKEKIKPLEAELKVIQGHIYKEMDNKGVDVLTRQGVEVVSRDEVTGAEQFDMRAFRKEHPLLFRKYSKGRKANYFRINWKTFIRFN